MPILELLATVSDDVDPNLSDNDGNTPLIFAAQAGQCVSYPVICPPASGHLPLGYLPLE